jgi:hypothetical protein
LWEEFRKVWRFMLEKTLDFMGDPQGNSEDQNVVRNEEIKDHAHQVSD